jgi:glycosyltransferase involved in cell wall biosynthesis
LALGGQETARAGTLGTRPAASEILFVVGSLQIGGTERHIASITPKLIAAGWRITIYTLAEGGALGDELRRQGVEVISPPVRRGEGVRSLPVRIYGLFVTAAHLFSTCLSLRPRIAHFFLPASYLIGEPIAMAARIPLRVMSRRSLNIYQKRRPLFGRLERLLHPYTNLIVGNSQSVVDQLRDEEHVAPRKLRLIYNGLDIGSYTRNNGRAAARAALGLPPDTLVFVILANLIPYKGHADLIDALGLAEREIQQDWRLLVAGRDDGIQADLERRAVRLGVADKIMFLGQRRDVPTILSAADVGLLCSHEEGFSNAILEKMASGLPMIVTDVGGNGEAVMDGVTGFVVPPRHPQALANAIVRMAKDAELRATFGAAGRQRIVEHFSLERCVERYDALYRELLGSVAPEKKDTPARFGECI